MSNVKENIIGTQIGIYDVLYECDFKSNDNHKMYHVRCHECEFETAMKKSDIKRAKQCTHIGKLTKEQLESWYEKNKRQCLFCGEFIPLGNNNFHEYKERKFCNNSCAASYNNHHSDRYKNKRSIKPKQEKKCTDNNKTSNEHKKQKKQNAVHKRPPRQCSICGINISDKNKSGYCHQCKKKIDNENKIKKWQTTGETGCSVGATIRNCIRRYIYDKQEGRCAICGMQDTWNNKELHFILDHIDGDASNNWENNLRLICPNCDSQLDTYKSKNKNSARAFRKKYI